MTFKKIRRQRENPINFQTVNYEFLIINETENIYRNIKRKLKAIIFSCKHFHTIYLKEGMVLSDRHISRN